MVGCFSSLGLIQLMVLSWRAPLLYTDTNKPTISSCTPFWSLLPFFTIDLSSIRAIWATLLLQNRRTLNYFTWLKRLPSSPLGFSPLSIYRDADSCHTHTHTWPLFYSPSTNASYQIISTFKIIFFHMDIFNKLYL